MLGSERAPIDIMMRGRAAPTSARELAERRAAAAAAAAAAFPPQYFPPLGASNLFAAAQLSLGPGPTALTPIPGCSFTVPANNVGVVRGLTLNVNNLLTTSLITFSLLINGAPLPGFANMFIFPRLAASLASDFPPENTSIEIPDGATVSVAAQVNDPGTYQLGATFRGWYWSKALAG